MQMIEYTCAKDDSDLKGILDLQRLNLGSILGEEEMQREGFVTVMHSLDDLRKMNNIESHIIARDKGKVIAYLLAMTCHSKHDIPILIPMFEVFERITFEGKPLNQFNFIVVGQACVDKAYRGEGVFDNCYDHYRKVYFRKYDFAITEIDASNVRSQRAHSRVGFRTIHEYIAPNNITWKIVVLDWRHRNLRLT